MELKIKNEDIVQLRQNDLNRGRNKSNAPVYPKTVPEAIINLSSFLSKEGINGITTVDVLPDTGEEGKIYYNRYDCSYYTTYNGEFEKIGKDSIDVIAFIDDVPRISPSDPAERNSYLLTPNVFYNIGDWNRSHTPGEDAYMVFALNRNYEGIYAGRFTAWADDLNISWPSTVVIPDNVPDIINGHQYEFNIWQDVLILVDVTSTVQDNDVENDEEQGGE